MRLPFPTKVPLWGAILFAIVLCLFEVLQGTSTFFTLGVFAYIIVSVLAFNAAGGLSTPSGGYIFFQVVLTALFGFVMKAVLWEAADSRLRVPETTIMANLGFSLVMLIAVYVKRPLTKKPAILSGLLTPASTRQATIGCVIIAIAIDAYSAIAGLGDGTLASALNRANVFLPIAILIGTFDTVRRSGGRKNVSLIAVFAGVYSFVIVGLLRYSKEAMLASLVAWLIAVAASGGRLSLRQIAFILVAGAGIVYFLVPYAQGGRVDRGTPGNQLDKAMTNLSRIDEFRAQTALDAADAERQPNEPLFYDEKVGFLERFQMISWDDALIETAVNGSTLGYTPLLTYMYNIVPHFLWPDKPVTIWGNFYAHRIGMLADDDIYTGVSFSPVAEVFLMDGWNSLFFVCPFIYIVVFAVIDSVGGDVRYNPWGLFFTMISAHNANEGMLAAPFTMATFLTPLLIGLAYFTVYVLPLIGSLLLPRSRAAIMQGRTQPRFIRETPS
ncbi:hypothetical protein FTW19_24675 [Terriglobus albidus]|uniref:Oligosaccharide repeat unit polymerase n=1 Tax=Terriglobus albidus TaxID=1592106 RepID=A0A5B9EFB3_9BACT|nr:hypothetical protein [Terriglobus albidus]QEE30913.1 hypothetical protein FTW19_24675 [Terriglobus albidus]